MTTPCKPFYFTGEPDVSENATNWLSTIEANINSSMTNREKVDLFSSWLRRASPARKWFNKLPDEGHRRWHLVHDEFESKWFKTTDEPVLVALLSTDTSHIPDPPTTIPQLGEPTSQPNSTPDSTITFTISYTPLLHPEPAATRSGTNAIQVTQFELNKMLQQAFQQGSERGYQLDLADTIEKLNTQYEDRLAEAFNDFADREQESSDNAFGQGFSAGIREERERWESVHAPQVSVETQTDPTSSTAIQTTPLITSPSSTATISTQTEPSPTIIPHSDSSPVPISEPLSTVSAPFNWADDTYLPPAIPLIPTKQPRDLSILRSSTKNPFSSLRRRHHQKYSNTFSSRPYTLLYPTLHHTPPLPNNSLDWHRDPRLFELSRVLRTLGWSHP